MMSIKKRFWLALMLALPMLYDMLAMFFNWPMIPNGDWVALILTTLIMLISGRAFVQSAWAAFLHPCQHGHVGCRWDHDGISVQYLRAIASSRRIF